MRRRFRAVSLPVGLTVDPHTGHIRGIPAKGGQCISGTILYGTLPAWLLFRFRAWWHGNT